MTVSSTATRAGFGFGGGIAKPPPAAAAGGGGGGGAPQMDGGAGAGTAPGASRACFWPVAGSLLVWRFGGRMWSASTFCHSCGSRGRIGRWITAGTGTYTWRSTVDTTPGAAQPAHLCRPKALHLHHPKNAGPPCEAPAAASSRRQRLNPPTATQLRQVWC